MSDRGLPIGWTSGRFGDFWTLAQNGCGARNGTGKPTVVLRLADVTTEGRIAKSGLREIPLSDEDREKYALMPGDLLAFRVNGSPQITGQVISYPGPAGNAFCDHFIRFRVPDACLDTRFVAYAFRVPPWRSQVSRAMVSTAGQNTVSQKTFSGIQLPMPPLSEQHRIVEALESYFTRLDAAVATLERVQRNLKRYRASVLKAAVEGRLVPTEAELARAEGRDYEPASVLLDRILAERRRRWDQAGRQGKYAAPATPNTRELPQLQEGWCWATTEMLAELKGGLTKGQKRQPTNVLREVPYLRVANVQRGHLDLSIVKTIMATEIEIDELRLHPGDVLFNEGGDRDKLGRGWVWNGELPECIHQNHVFRARMFTADLHPKLLSWYGNTAGQQYFFEEGKQTTNLASINLTKLRSLPVPIPPLAEQTRIVEQAERLLSLADEAERLVGVDSRRCTRLRQSILEWAFEGKLADQDPDDEPAAVLLERIRSQTLASRPGAGDTADSRRRAGGRRKPSRAKK